MQLKTSRTELARVVGAVGKNHHLGYFAEKSDAIAAREAAEVKFHFHPNHGAPGNDNQRLVAA